MCLYVKSYFILVYIIYNWNYDFISCIFFFYFEIGYIRLIWIKINILVMINNKIYYILLNLCISRSELRGVI